MTQKKLNERQERIAELLRHKGEVKISELSGSFQVAEMTIRRDLERLEQLGMVRRTFGGAIAAYQHDIALTERSGTRTEEKARIGRAAAKLIQPGEAVFIDAGSTTLQLAKYWPEAKDATAVTHALHVALELMGKRVPTLVVGGLLREATSSLVGPIAEETLGKMAFDRVFIGAAGFTLEHGFSNSNVFEAEVKRAAIARAKDVTALIDHSKFGRQSLASFADLTRVTRIITDRLPDQEVQEACARHGIELMIARD
jgi:DeoR/GlpR family transcriptional regulator of sugar metabolism